MGRTIFTADDIPIPRERQEELYEGWHDLEWSPFSDEDDDAETVRDRCREILSELPDSANKKEQIAALYVVLGDEDTAISHHTIADTVGCTRDYARRFEYLYDERAVVKRTAIDPDLRYQVRGEDDGCVRCGATDDIEIHHIIPYSQGGEDTRENLASLCPSCHREAHGETWQEVDYDSKEEFWNWARYTIQ